MKTFAFDLQEVKVSEKKTYFVDEYAHVLKALAEGKPVHHAGFRTACEPHEVLHVIRVGKCPPHNLRVGTPPPDIPIDAPVWARHTTGWFARHFAGYADNGAPTVWAHGRTSHTQENDGYPSKLPCYEISLTKPEGVK